MREKKDEHVIYERCKGIVKFYSRDKGFGFCKRDNKPDVFLSLQALEKAGLSYVKAGEVLEFDLVPVHGKPSKATNIKKVEK